MDHRRVGGLEPLGPRQFAIRRDIIKFDDVVGDTRGEIPVGDQFAGARVDLRMRGPAFAIELAVEIIEAERLERIRINQHRPRRFLGRKQFARVEDDRGVRGRAVAAALSDERGKC